MKQKIFTLKIYTQGTHFLFNMTESDVLAFEVSLKKDQWLCYPQTSGIELKIKSSEIKCYETLNGSSLQTTKKGEMTLVRLAELMSVHPVTVSRMATSGKIPVIQTKGARRTHSRATLESALALRENLIKLGRQAPSVEKIKEQFK
ncbi:MAG: hypothetical protein H7235_04370 [Bdellovibrionaceae bacterium]|nr:hypothetical protein [Pseudobdellovibrionaceae bacterium]